MRKILRTRFWKEQVLTTLFILIAFFIHAQGGMVSSFDSHSSPSPYNTYELKGNLYLFEKYWVHARVELPDHKVLQNDSLFFNYDKMNQKLLVTKDFKSMLTVDKENFISVTFFMMDSVFILEHVDLISSRDLFFEILRDDNKYSLYKHILTAFTDVNYHSNGLASGGNDYATLEDHNVYYIVFPNKEYKKLNKADLKSIQKAFKTTPDRDKVESWLTGKNETGESLLLDLIMYLNG